MSTLRSGTLVALVVAAAGVCAPGCARRNTPAAPATMRIGVGAPQNQSQGSGAKFVVDALTTETWLTMLADGRQAERLVTRWSWDEPRTTLTLTLRPDVYFHDGTRLTPQIAAEALRKSTASELYPSYPSVQSVIVSGDAVQIRLKEPNAFLPLDLALTSLRLPTNPRMGTGPFQVAASTQDQTILKPFPRYYRGAPRLGEIDVTIYPTQRKAWAALMRGDLDMLHEVSRDAADFVEAETTVNTYSFPRPYYIPLVFNLRHAVLKRADVRRAINQAIDRRAIVQDGMRGHGSVADGPIWPQHWAYPANSPRFPFDRSGARVLLDQAGLVATRNPSSNVPTRFSFSCLMWAEDTRFERLAVLVQKQLADVGIDMRLVPLPQTQLVQRLRDGDFDAFLFEMAGRSLGWIYTFWHSQEGPTMNNNGYRAADQVLDQLKTARTDDEIKARVAELASILHDDPPAAFLAWQETSRAVTKRFDVAPEENRDIFTNIWQWRLAAEGSPEKR